MNSSLPLVSVQDVSFGYDRKAVLESVSLDIQAGDFLAVLGPNGSGKKTLLRLILGLLRPRQGRIFVEGSPPSDCQKRGLIGYVPQKAARLDALFPATVEETVAMAFQTAPGRVLSLGGRRKKREAVRWALTMVGMEGERSRRIGRLSGGQQQRVFIARALVNRPRLLILDEPTTGVDVETQEHFYEMLWGFNRREGITIVLVTHDIGIVDRHVNKVACLNQRLTYHGSHEDFCRSEAFRQMIAGGHHLVSHRH